MTTIALTDEQRAGLIVPPGVTIPAPRVRKVKKVKNPLWRRIAKLLRIGTWNVDSEGRIRRGDYIQTYTGRLVYPLDPVPEDVNYDDGCVGIARECRYGNQCLDYYSVAEHSVIVSLFCERLARERGWSEEDCAEAGRYGLLHDYPEGWLSDVPRPLKRQRVMKWYAKVEARWWKCVVEWAGLRPGKKFLELVKEVDNRLLMDEFEMIMVAPERSRAWFPPGMQPLGADIACMSWEQAACAFGQRFAECFPHFLEGS